jgi:hypothetical protein
VITKAVRNGRLYRGPWTHLFSILNYATYEGYNDTWTHSQVAHAPVLTGNETRLIGELLKSQAGGHRVPSITLVVGRALTDPTLTNVQTAALVDVVYYADNEYLRFDPNLASKRIFADPGITQTQQTDIDGVLKTNSDSAGAGTDQQISDILSAPS